MVTKISGITESPQGRDQGEVVHLADIQRFDRGCAAPAERTATAARQIDVLDEWQSVLQRLEQVLAVGRIPMEAAENDAQVFVVDALADA